MIKQYCTLIKLFSQFSQSDLIVKIYKDMILEHPEYIESVAEGTERVLGSNRHALLVFEDYFLQNHMVRRLLYE